jgi:membrane protease YdiL (CAAX protease family)
MKPAVSILESVSKPASAKQKSEPKPVQPLPLRSAILLFAVPAALTFLSFHLFRPWLETFGYSPLKSFLGALTVPVALLFAAALVAYNKVENQPLQWDAFAERMRFPRLQLKDVLLGIGLFVAASVGYAIFSRLAITLIDAGLIQLPANLPTLVDPRASLTLESLDRSAGGILRGQWDLLLLYLVAFFFNIVGEELWWRGYILPRQELRHGKWTWLLHGTLWTLFHFFKWWDLIGLLPVCLVLSFAAQRLRNNWPVLIAHALINGLSVLAVAAGVAGML